MGKKSNIGSYKVSAFQGFYREWVTVTLSVTDAFDNRWSLLGYTTPTGFVVTTAFESGNQPRGGMAHCKYLKGATYEEALAAGIQEFWARSPLSVALNQYRGSYFQTSRAVALDEDDEES